MTKVVKKLSGKEDQLKTLMHRDNKRKKSLAEVMP